jgi:hypothetical protein
MGGRPQLSLPNRVMPFGQAPAEEVTDFNFLDRLHLLLDLRKYVHI